MVTNLDLYNLKTFRDLRKILFYSLPILSLSNLLVSNLLLYKKNLLLLFSIFILHMGGLFLNLSKTSSLDILIINSNSINKSDLIIILNSLEYNNRLLNNSIFAEFFSSNSQLFFAFDLGVENFVFDA